jgi:hypothetical protein
MEMIYRRSYFKLIKFYIFFLVLLFTNCTDAQEKIDKSKMNGFDFRLYDGTPAWELAQAVRDQDVKKIREQVKKNKKILSFKDEHYGGDMLQMAVKTVKYNSAKELVELGADPNTPDKYNGSTALMEAADIGHGGPMGNFRTDIRFLTLLLKHGADPNLAEQGERRQGYYNRMTPLLIACKKGVLEYVKALVEAGASINYTNEYRQTSLREAVLSENPEVVLYLLQHGADYTKYFRKTVTGRKIYIDNDIKDWNFETGSKNYKIRQQIIEFLKLHPDRS